MSTDTPIRFDLKQIAESFSYHHNKAEALREEIFTITRPATAYGTWKTDDDLLLAGGYAYNIGWKNIPPASFTKTERHAWMKGWKQAHDAHERA